MYKPITLKYPYSALEPFLNERIIDIHYNKHYLSYLNKLNKLLTDNNYKYNYPKEYLIDNINIFPMAVRGDILYNLGGVLNHELYFNSMGPNNHLPQGKILELINRDYQNYDNFKKEFQRVASNLVGSGYTFLTLDSNNKLYILNTSNQDSPFYYGFKPILALDLWEHAYYLQYLNNRQEYITNFFNIIDWNNVNNELNKYLPVS